MSVHPIPVLSRRVERRTFTCSHGIEGQWDGACTECKTLSEKADRLARKLEQDRQRARQAYEKKKAEQNQPPSHVRTDTPAYAPSDPVAEGAEAPSGVNNPERAPAKTPEETEDGTPLIDFALAAIRAADCSCTNFREIMNNGLTGQEIQILHGSVASIARRWQHLADEIERRAKNEIH